MSVYDRDDSIEPLSRYVLPGCTRCTRACVVHVFVVHVHLVHVLHVVHVVREYTSYTFVLASSLEWNVFYLATS